MQGECQLYLSHPRYCADAINPAHRFDAGHDFDTYDPEEIADDFAPDVDENALEEEVAAANGDEKNNEDQNDNSGNKQVVTGDVDAEQKKPPTTDNDKRIPDDKRSTTPYMTKYERARVLGTRALQIR